MSSIILRPYQTQAIEQMRALMRKGCKSILYQGSTGSGKTCLTAHMLHTAAGKGMRSLFVVHRRELIKQSAEAFDKEGLKYGVISSGFNENVRELVQLGSIQTLVKRFRRIGAPKLIVWDECHHLAARSWTSLFKYFPDSFQIGLSATPARLDGQGLGTFFKEIIQGPSVQTLISQGYLSPYKLYAPMRVSTEGVHTKMGDYVKSELQGVMDRPSITGDAVQHYRKYADGKRALVFCVSIQHSQHVAAQFQAAGYLAQHVDGETPTEERDETMDKFKKGSIQILTSVEIFGEGVDVPALECVILLRPTQSLGLYLQQVGRSLRPAPGKREATILDAVGNCERHGLPDEDREWSIEGTQRPSPKEQGSNIHVRICPSCFGAMGSTLPTCKFCGFTFEVTPREVREKEGELTEVDREALARDRRRDQGQAESLEALYRLGVARKYRYPRRWAWYVFKSRQAKKLGKVA